MEMRQLHQVYNLHHVKSGGVLMDDKHFISGVVKIQRGNFLGLSHDEIAACTHLRRKKSECCSVSDSNSGDSVDNDSDSSGGSGSDSEDSENSGDRNASTIGQYVGPSMDEVLFSAIQMEDERQDSNPYIDCSFILATAVIVERLWSVAGRLLSATRRSMTPEIFEAILFLHINRDFWDDELVYKAIELAKEARVKIRSQKKNPQASRKMEQ